jgi:hypothetical protein
MDVQMQTEGRRIYISGNTYPIKSDIKAAGGHWDGARRAWWVGVGKREELARALNQATPTAPVQRETTVIGKAEYKGRTYFVIWHGETKFGHSMKLTTLDEKIEFWASASKGARVIKEYQERKTLASIRDFVSDKREQKRNPQQYWETHECPACARAERGGYLREHLFDGCDVCGNEDD